MWKYYLLLFASVAAVLAYTYIADPCNRMLRSDFALKYPSYAIEGSEARKGSPEAVLCHISYRKPGDVGIYEETWLYQYDRTSWKFSRVVEAEKRRQALP